MRQLRVGAGAGIAGVLLAGAPVLEAQRGVGSDYLFRPPVATFTIHGGLATPRAGSELFAFSMQELTLGRSDFTSGAYGADLALMLRGPLDLVIGFAHDESHTGSEFRDWVDNNDQPIEQATRFSRQPFTATVRYNFAARGRRVGSLAWVPTQFVPFVGVGGGLMKYRFEQVGDFINETTLEVFYDRYTEKGWSPVGQVSAGATWNLTPLWQFVGEVRYLRGQGKRTGPGDDFVGFERLDLSGMSTSIGISLRF